MGIYDTDRYNEVYEKIKDIDKRSLVYYLAELYENYNDLCDRIEYEEGWDPRKED
jgi:hypothetical protein